MTGDIVINNIYAKNSLILYNSLYLLNMKYVCIILFLLFAFSMCTPDKKENDPDKNSFIQKDSVFITYFTGDFISSKSIWCEKISKIQLKHPKNQYPNPEVIDTFVVDSHLFKKLREYIQSRNIIDAFNEDARMFVTMKHADGDRNEICIDVFGTFAKINGIPCEMTNEILFLLRDYSGYYNWLDHEYLINLPELNDTTFVRERAKSYSDKIKPMLKR